MPHEWGMAVPYQPAVSLHPTFFQWGLHISLCPID